jgi:WD40-like Beta Propeller Repeat
VRTILTVLAISAMTVPSQAAGPRYVDWNEPINLGSVINSPYVDRHPAISKDGLTLYFASNYPGGFGNDDIWVSHRASPDEPWDAPQVLGPNVNTAAIEYAPTFSRDGHWLFFNSTRPDGFGGEDIWVSYREHTHDDEWEPAVNLGPTINSANDDGGPTLFEDDDARKVTLYFASNRPGGPGDFDIYAAVLNPNGFFDPPVLVPQLSSPARDSRTAIRHDGLELFLTSNRTETLGGLDLWVSTRPTTLDVWSTPTNLGPVVNSAFADGAPALSSDGETLFFYSARPGGFGGLDLYVSTRQKLHGN